MEINLQSLEKLNKPQLEDAINELIKNDFSRLVQILYRIDVSEAKLKYLLNSHPNEDAGKLIAQVILERLAATKKARESFNTTPRIDDTEERL
ncbi:MAG: hypothetical protein RLZ56_525 [Bacteroidota bacterium]|jgi:hypothetical protein